MADVKSGSTKYVEFILRSETSNKFVMHKKPIGWREDGLSYVRHEKYHGIMVEFSGDLGFHGEARKYILNDFNELGINSNLLLDKYELIDTGEGVRFDQTYSGIVDYKTMKDENGVLSLKFNSNLLEELIKTREGDEFDLEREFSINNDLLDELDTNLVNIKGIPLSEQMNLELRTDSEIDEGVAGGDDQSDYARGKGDHQLIVFQGNPKVMSPILKLIVDGNNRVSSPDTTIAHSDYASSMFFVDSVSAGVDDQLDVTVKVSYSMIAEIKTVYRRGSDLRHTLRADVVLSRLKRNPNTLKYDLVSSTVLQSVTANRYDYVDINVSGEHTFENLAHDEGLVFGIVTQRREYLHSNKIIRFKTKVYESNLSVILNTFKPETKDHKFIFVDKCLNRLMYILTGEKDRFESKIFSRGNNSIVVKGEYGSIGLTYGMWIRKFTKSYPIYKSMKISLGKAIESLQAVFNVGVGIELIDGKQKLVVEDLKYFYQQEVKIRLKDQVSNTKVELDKKGYFSSIEIGYDKGGSYSDTLGLDEPNVRTNRITPIIKNKLDYKKVSSIRADDIGLEITRRKPASLNPKSTTQEDDHIWFLDLKGERTFGSRNFYQKTWEDRLSFKPYGLSYGDYFKSFFFTPMRILLRHGWVIRAGLNEEVNLNKKISHINSEANSGLVMKFMEDDKPYKESDDVSIRDLDVPLMEPKLIEFTYPMSTEFLRQIKSKSDIDYNGYRVSVPNYYFRIEWVDEDRNIQSGYIVSLKPSENKIKVIKSNNKNRI